jgi:hypothetical protein
MLRIYIADHCRSCSTAFQLAERLQIERPNVPLDIVDVDDPEADVPANVIGTPMYLWNDRVLFMGNPSELELLQRVGALHDDTR